MPGSDKTTKSSKPADAVPHYHGHRSRLRERFVQGGSDALHDYEMLELILFRAIPRRDVKPLAKELLEKFGAFPEVGAAPVERLKEIDGLGEAAIADLKIVQAAANRLLRGEVKQRHVLSSWSNVLDYCRTVMAFESKEHFRILFLDKANHLIADEQHQTGTVDHTPVYPREVIKRALELSATAVILEHNHPTWSEVIPPAHVQCHLIIERSALVGSVISRHTVGGFWGIAGLTDPNCSPLVTRLPPPTSRSVKRVQCQVLLTAPSAKPSSVSKSPESRRA